MKRKLKAAAIQMDASPAPVPRRLSRAADLIAEAARAGAQLVALPELFNTGYEFSDRNYALAEPIDGKSVSWMKSQVAKHGIHLAGTLLLLDKVDIYNAALLLGADGRMWRYDKIYVPLWERAYFRAGDQITVADTDLGKLGMMICWDSNHSDLWSQYAGKVDAVVVMSCSWSETHLVFPDGYRIGLFEFGESMGAAVHADEDSAARQPSDLDVRGERAAWISVPVVYASATGAIRSRVPCLETMLRMTNLSDRASQASEVWFESQLVGMPAVVDSTGEVLARGTAEGDGVTLAEAELADVPPQPLGEPPKTDFSSDAYYYADELIPKLMIPVYREGVRRQWGAHMAPD